MCVVFVLNVLILFSEMEILVDQGSLFFFFLGHFNDSYIILLILICHFLHFSCLIIGFLNLLSMVNSSMCPIYIYTHTYACI